MNVNCINYLFIVMTFIDLPPPLCKAILNMSPDSLFSKIRWEGAVRNQLFNNSVQLRCLLDVVFKCWNVVPRLAATATLLLLNSMLDNTLYS